MERAAGLTRQLLAFSQPQALARSAVDLNAVVAGFESMLRRVLGPQIEFVVAAAPDLGLVRIDVGQVEQVILNLVINARDAMIRGGAVRLSTANVDRDDGVEGVPAARYVTLAVSDTGTGMDEETRRHLFEAFFTTKPPGDRPRTLDVTKDLETPPWLHFGRQ
ncbi:MAG: ATP-binding protein [Deltaproteobacteria bacterium]|nr:ATP-binding protein [Deltaproteobacteria bacterium]